MPIAHHSRELPSIGCLFPDMSEPGSGVEFLSAARVIFVAAVCSDFHRSVSRDRENSDALLIKRSAIFRVLRAAFLRLHSRKFFMHEYHYAKEHAIARG